jgi:hypothetical protein
MRSNTNNTQHNQRAKANIQPVLDSEIIFYFILSHEQFSSRVRTSVCLINSQLPGDVMNVVERKNLFNLMS